VGVWDFLAKLKSWERKGMEMSWNLSDVLFPSLMLSSPL